MTEERGTPAAILDNAVAMLLTLSEVIERYRGPISEGTLRIWRSMRVGPA
jgi:hypothetical protein